MRPNFFLHLHPPHIPAEQARWRYTLGAGGTAVFLVLVLVVSGLLEMFYYVPSPSDAALSIQTLSYLVPFGGLVRNIHFWAAQLLVVVVVLHLVRVVLTGAYAPPRRFNYLLGLALFAMVIMLDFTGYILRWDKGIQWALVVGTNLVKSIPWAGNLLYRIVIGGEYPGAPTLTRFFSWHIYGLMLPVAVLVGWHVFRVRRDGGIAVPPPHLRTDTKRISRDALMHQEVIAMLLCGSALLLLSAIAPAPIAPAITKITAESGDASAPWFFLWIQQMLKWGNPFIWGVVVPLVILTLIGLIPFVFPLPALKHLGRWLPPSNRLAQIMLVVLGLVVLLLTMFELYPVF